jgi:hypothetical protein
MSASRIVHVLYLRLHHLLPRNLAPMVCTLKIGRANKYVFANFRVSSDNYRDTQIHTKSYSKVKDAGFKKSK